LAAVATAATALVITGVRNTHMASGRTNPSKTAHLVFSTCVDPLLPHLLSCLSSLITVASYCCCCCIMLLVSKWQTIPNMAHCSTQQVRTATNCPLMILFEPRLSLVHCHWLWCHTTSTSYLLCNCRCNAGCTYTTRLEVRGNECRAQVCLGPRLLKTIPKISSSCIAAAVPAR
jgi:hypothetical protein